MSSKGSHGDGHPTNTETPLVVFGAGIAPPKEIKEKGKRERKEECEWGGRSDNPPPFSPKEWHLAGFERRDVDQADVAAIIASLLGVRFPKNSVGVVPVEVLDVSDAIGVKILIQNTRFGGGEGEEARERKGEEEGGGK